jgi:hypothetical protein
MRKQASTEMAESSSAGGGNNERLPDSCLPLAPRAGGAAGCASAAGSSAGGICREDSGGDGALDIAVGAAVSKEMTVRAFRNASTIKTTHLKKCTLVLGHLKKTGVCRLERSQCGICH